MQLTENLLGIDLFNDKYINISLANCLKYLIQQNQKLKT